MLHRWCVAWVTTSRLNYLLSHLRDVHAPLRHGKKKKTQNHTRPLPRISSWPRLQKGRRLDASKIFNVTQEQRLVLTSRGSEATPGGGVHFVPGGQKCQVYLVCRFTWAFNLTKGGLGCRKRPRSHQKGRQIRNHQRRLRPPGAVTRTMRSLILFNASTHTQPSASPF